MPAFLDSSMVEHAAVNRGVVGSSPTRGVKPAAGAAAKRPVNTDVYGLFMGEETAYKSQKEKTPAKADQ